MKNLTVLLVLALIFTANLLAVALKRAGVLPADRAQQIITQTTQHASR